MTFSEQLKADIALIEPALEKYLSRETGEGYDRIFEAAKYSAMAGGKRLRPVIVLEFCRLCGGDIEKTLPLSLIHICLLQVDKVTVYYDSTAANRLSELQSLLTKECGVPTERQELIAR